MDYKAHVTSGKMLHLLNEVRPQIEQFLYQYFQEKNRQVGTLHPLSHDMIQRITPYSCHGKMIRGSLIAALTQTMGGNIQKALPAAAAVELWHSGILIHDDIIDEDNLRRGEPSMHAQYTAYAKTNHIGDPHQYGPSIALCVGDILFFWCYELLSSLDLTPTQRQELNTLFSSITSQVAVGEMIDITFGCTKENYDMNEIVHMYILKTARYTFSLPLGIAAILTNQNEEVKQQLWDLGGLLGIQYQIKDDEVGLLGTEQEIGKPVGSDIRENKKTLHRNTLHASATAEEKHRLEHIFGNKHATVEEVAYVQHLAVKYRIAQQVREQTQHLETQVNMLLRDMNINKESKQLIEELATHLQSRRS